MVRPRPPSPDGLPLVGHTLSLVREQGDFYERAGRLGDVVTVSLAGVGELHLLTDPGLIERVLLDGHGEFTKADFSRDQLGELLGEGLVLSRGDLWRRQRQRIQPAFYRERIARYADVMTARAADAVERWESGDVVDVETEMKRLTLRILFEAMFGTDVDYEGRNVRETVRHLQAPGLPRNQPVAQAVPKRVPIPMWRRYLRAVEEMESLIEDVVAERRGSDDDRDDLLSMLLTGEDDEGEEMTDRQVRDELMTFLFAGHETTATALTFTLYLLATRADVARTLRAELDDVLGGAPPAMADLADLDYTEQVVREAMRLYPPVPTIPREATRRVELGRYTLEPGETVAASQWIVHRDGSWYEYPHEFRPERWAGDRLDDLPDGAYFPFGLGPRRCIGERFALTEAQLLLATVAQAFEFDLVSEPDLDVSVSITTRPTNPIRLELESR